MVELCMQRQGDALVPASESDRRELILLPERRYMTVVANPAAPLKMQRWFHACVQLLVEATGRWPSAKLAKREILIRTGHFDSLVIHTDGTHRVTPQDTSLWEHVEWRAFLTVAVPFIIENYVGETQGEFRRRVERFVGVGMKEAMESDR